jgi:hypothetical protein
MDTSSHAGRWRWLGPPRDGRPASNIARLGATPAARRAVEWGRRSFWLLSLACPFLKPPPGANSTWSRFIRVLFWLAAWIGLVPRQHSTGGKDRLGRISKQGNRHLRWLLVAGAMAVIRYARQHGTKRLWFVRLMGRRPVKVAAVALANKIARMAWAMMVRGERFNEPKLLPAA